MFSHSSHDHKITVLVKTQTVLNGVDTLNKKICMLYVFRLHALPAMCSFLSLPVLRLHKALKINLQSEPLAFLENPVLTY